MNARPRCVDFFLLLILTLALGWGHARAGEAPAARSSPEETTEVIGEIPVDLRGIWMLVAHGYVKEELGRTTVEFYSIEGEEQRLRVHLLPWKLPPKMQEKLDRANQSYQVWRPSAKEIEEISHDLGRLPRDEETHYARHTVKVVARDHYEGVLKGEGPELAAGSDFALEISHDYKPRPLKPGEQIAQLMKDRALYAVRSAEPTLLEGEHTRVVLAAGPVPLPFAFRGPFWMHRLRGADEEEATLAERLANLWHALFRGCQ